MVDSLRLLYKGQITMDAKRTTLVAGPWTGYSWRLEEFRKDGQLIADPNKSALCPFIITKIGIIEKTMFHP